MTQEAFVAGTEEGPGSPTLDSYRRARAALDEAVEVAGGETRVQAIRAVLVERRGHLHMRNQSPRPEGPYLELPRTGRLALDLAGGRAAFERIGEFAGGYVDALRTVLVPEGGFEIDLHVRTVRLYPGLGPAHFEWIHRVVPPLLLRRALERRATLRWLGESERDGVRCVVHLPAERLVFEGDLLNVPYDGPIAPASESTAHFAGVLDELGLDVETIVGVHGTVGTRADLDRALALRGAGRAGSDRPGAVAAPRPLG